MLLHPLIPDKPVKWEIAEPIADLGSFGCEREPIPMVTEQILVASVALHSIKGVLRNRSGCSVAQVILPLQTPWNWNCIQITA